jgi:LacI family transcriptional regulator
MSSTLKDIAKQLNVSVSTVSRALQDHPRIGIKTREQVKELALKMDYQPNASAINLKKRSTQTLGVIVPEIAMPFFSFILSGIDDAAQKAGYNLLICQSGENYEREKEQILNLCKTNVDGILIAASKQTADYGHFHELRRKGFPVVFFSRAHPDFPGVLSDDVGGARAATEHLISQGCKTIAHIAGPWHLRHTHDRVNGYVNALKAHNIEPKPEYIMYSDMERENNTEVIYKLLSLPVKPDGIFCFNDNMAFDIIQVLKERSISVGKEIRVVGYANQPICTYMEPGLSSVDQQAFIIGQKSVEMMLQILKGEIEKDGNESAVLETRLVVRDSS